MSGAAVLTEHIDHASDSAVYKQIADINSVRDYITQHPD
jgi:hypothetical protein